MTFETALTGLNAAAADLDVTGNNIANSQTVGFKSSRAEFADIFATSSLGVSQNAIGQGVRLAAVRQQFTQGQFAFTGNSLDLAINGNGFYRLSDGGEIVYTRAGSFNLDRDGYMVDNNGRRLQGYGVDAGGAINTGSIQSLRVNTGDVSPEITTEMSITANLQASAEILPGSPAIPFSPDDYNFSTSTTVFDSQGGGHLVTFYYIKTADNIWEMHAHLADPDPLNPPIDIAGGGETITFDTDGTLLNPDPPMLSLNTGGPLTLGGAELGAIDLDIASITQYGTPFSVTELSQNGYAAGQFSSMSVESDGTVFARYTNGKSAPLGQIVLAQFPSPQNLQQIGDTSWVETLASGQPLLGQPGNSGLGDIQSGSLEQSNVNVTEQLVKMITAQRNYQANAKMISTQDQMSQEILNIR